MSDSAVSDHELLPPDQTFWNRYSPRHECPIAGSASMLVHLVALGGVVLAGLAMSWRWYGDNAQPPAMSIVYLEGGTGNGRPVGGGSGSPTKGIENVEPGPQTPQPPAPAAITQAPLVLPKPAVTGDDPDVFVPKAAAKTDEKAYAKILDDLKNSPASQTAKANGVPNGNANGNGGNGTGPGPGTGKGTGVGPGNGPGDGTGPGGATTKALRAQILANRWRFQSGGSPRERVARFAAFGMKLGFTDFAGNLYVIENLKVRPVRFRVEPAERYKDTVIWGLRNNNPEDVVRFSLELGLPATASDIALMLPPDREQKMADEEMHYAREKGYDFSKVERTLFDFVLTQGVYEPKVIGEAPFDKNVPSDRARGR